MAMLYAEDNTVFTVHIDGRSLTVSNHPLAPPDSPCDTHTFDTRDDLVLHGLTEYAPLTATGRRYVCTRAIEGATHVYGATLANLTQFVSEADVARVARDYEMSIECVLARSALTGDIIIPINTLPYITTSIPLTRALQLLFTRVANYAMTNLALVNRVRMVLFRELMAQHAAHIGEQLAAVEARTNERCTRLEEQVARQQALLERAMRIEQQQSDQIRELSLRLATISSQMANMQRTKYSHITPSIESHRLVECIGERIDERRAVSDDLALRIHALVEVDRTHSALPPIPVIGFTRKRQREDNDDDAAPRTPPASRRSHKVPL